MRVYILGPMTGIHNDNRDAFNEVAASLRKIGFDVINPAELDRPEEKLTRLQCYERDIPYLPTCDAGVALPGWRHSTGASYEAITFVTLEKPIYKWPSMRQLRPDELPKIVHPNQSNTSSEPTNRLKLAA